jgi:hypothetical protein
MALRAAGVPADDPSIQVCLTFNRSYQISDGGFRSWMSSATPPVDLLGSGRICSGGGRRASWRTSGCYPVSYLESLQQSSGLFAHSLKTGGDAIVSIPCSAPRTRIALSGQITRSHTGEQAPRLVSSKPGSCFASPAATLRMGDYIEATIPTGNWNRHRLLDCHALWG